MFTSTDSTSILDETTSPLFHSPESFNHVITHVFFPAELPMENDCTIENDLSLVGAVCAAAHTYTLHVCGTPEEDQWRRITKMLDDLQSSMQSESLDKDHILSQLRGMQTGDIVTLFVRHQNAAIILTRQENGMLFEPFEVSPREDAVKGSPGSLVCSYPWSAVETPNEVFDDEDFQSELAHFLSLPGAVDSNLPRPPAAHPEYMTALLTGILRVVGRTIDVTAISKRIRDNVGQWPRHRDPDAYQGHWRRSALWLLVRVAIQMSVERTSTGRVFYKRFILYFLCTLAKDENNTKLSNDLLYLMSSKIFRRLSKLDPLTPSWLSDIALESCTRLREILDVRWNELSARPSLFRNPSQEELVRDTKLSLQNSNSYIRKIISNPDIIRPRTPFDPNHGRRGTLEEFLSLDGSFFREAYTSDPDVTMYDVEQSVEHEIDDWVARVVHVNNACVQIDILMDQYLEKSGRKNAEHDSVKLLTMLEFFIALDKLALQEIPMLADYSPGIPIAWLEMLCLRKTTSLHRLSCAYQYLLARESRSRPGWSVLSNEFTHDSFPVRYYDQSTHLQLLRVRIEEETRGAESGDSIAAGTLDNRPESTMQQHSFQDGKLSRSPLPTSLLHAKVVVFELQCPHCFRTWRSATARIYRYIGLNWSNRIDRKDCRLLADVPELQPYLVEHHGPSLALQVRIVYSFPDRFQRNIPVMRYLLHHFWVDHHDGGKRKDGLWVWQQPRESFFVRIGYDLGPYPDGDPFQLLKKYADSTSHTSNDILAVQANYPASFSHDEFIAFVFLRSGSSLQWLNILTGLHNRTLNLRREQVHFLLVRAALQVGPLDPNTMTWVWHEELQDMSFCNALIDELDDLFMDGVGLIDGVFMGTISLLLSRILHVASNLPVNVHRGVSERAITLLQRVRRKTFSWVQELSYDLQMAPMNKARKRFLLCMAATCRSTFDVDLITLPQLVRSAEDVDALLSCSFFIQALRLRAFDTYLQCFLERDSHLTPTLEKVVRHVVLADPSDRGVDLAIARVFASYRPDTERLEALQYPSARWLTCNTNANQGQSSQMVHINLLNGQLRVDSQPFGRLPREISGHKEYEWIFADNECFVVPSDLPGMDLMTHTVSSNYKVHFSLQDSASLVVRAQCNQTGQVHQIIPSVMLYEDLPWPLIIGHIHLLNISSGVIEIRPMRQCWEQSTENWRIECTSGSYHAYKGRESLVDTRSQSWAMLSDCFEWLAAEKILLMDEVRQPRNILITTYSVDSVSMSKQQLTVSLPRHALSFFVNDRGELESRNFKHMVYDEDQFIQTLFGLNNISVLRPTTHIAGFSVPEALIARIVLVRDGYPSRMNGIDFDDHKYHTFKVDPDLGSLVGNGNLKSLRFLAYLHAMTSFHRPDPLSDKIGSQAACDFLQSAGCRSIARTGTLYFGRGPGDAVDRWTSTRYPQFNAALEEIRNRYYWDHEKSNAEKATEAAFDLQEKRAARRAIHLFPSNTDRQLSTVTETANDFDYAILDSEIQELENVIFAASSAVYRWSTSTPTMDTILNWTKTWRANMLVDLTSGLGHATDRELAQTLAIRVHDILETMEDTRQRFPLLFLLPTLAYCSSSHQATFLSMLMAFTPEANICPGNLNLLIHADHKLSDGYYPTKQAIYDLICSSRRRNELRPTRLSTTVGEEFAVDAAIFHLLNSWPSDSPPTILLDSHLWDTEWLTISLQQLFLSCYRNWSLKESLVRNLVVEVEPGPLTVPRRVLSAQYPSNQHKISQTTLDRLLSNRLPPELPQRNTLPRDGFNSSGKTSERWDGVPTLDRLFSSLHPNSAFQEEYLALLGTSAAASKEPFPTRRASTKDNIDILQQHYMKCRIDYMDAIGRLKKTLSPMTNHERVQGKFSHWPPITADALLRCLASTSRIRLSDQWKKCLILLAQLLLELQRARRLLQFALDDLEEELSAELENEQCDGWNPEGYPDWLLIQVQGNFLIRRAQAEVAMQLMFPRSGGNTIMQVNLGEGKSSVIIPIVAAALADGKQLVRVIVPKALTIQMFDILAARLGGLAQRPIYHIPFSRTAYNNPNNNLPVQTLFKLMSQCMTERGILLVQPEHVVSLKLMCVEKQINYDERNVLGWDFEKFYQYITRGSHTRGLSSEDSLVGSIFRGLDRSPNSSTTKDSGDSALDDATEWFNLQKWVHSHARDILDESDEILHPRFQMIYTIGFGQHADGYPDRWTITGHVLRLVKENLHTFSRNHPNSVEYERGTPGSFPCVRIVRASDIGQQLISMVVEDVMAGRLPNFDFQQISSAALCGAIRSFISDSDILQVSDTAKTVEEYAKRSHRSFLWNGLLVLRGLLSSNILLFALAERRWRVDYGHDTYGTSTMLAVPYRAKDVPAPNTQFGHPDLTVILTYLSYYYSGLTEAQLRISFEILLDQDDPTAEYQSWIKDYESLPDSLRKLSDINPRSSQEWDNVTFPLFARNQAVIDFYLSRVVFPRETMEFPWKLCGSSWDLGEKREKLVTGFSGTSDGRWLLPMSVVQHDLDHQRGASARVLARLLRQEQGKDSENYVVTHENGERQTTEGFLKLIATQRPEIRALLDVGGQILALSNFQVAQAWLDATHNAEAAVYFNVNDELMVLPRDSEAQPLVSSPFSQQLDKCIIYLDHPHTRGTDLQFPVGSRAAVTLGPKLTKDALTQGCMRMRKLGHGHTVMFFAPPGVDQSIRAVTGKHSRDVPVTISDILSWTIRETWADIEHRAPYWAQQGIDHQARYDALTHFYNDKLPPKYLSDVWLQPNRKPLAELYAPRETKDVQIDLSAVPGMQQQCKVLGILSLPDKQLEEEQEREVHREREREREVELPPEAEPAEHYLHPDVVSFVKSGVMPPLHSGSGAFLPVFTTLERSTAATRDADVWSPAILATVDFSRTIKPESTKGTMDQYLRPVQWILTGKTDRGPVLVILSPFEANLLMPDIRLSKHVHLHLYTARTAERMKPVDDLRLYTIPPLPSGWTPPWELIDQLNVFAGQLYLRDYKSYLRLCRFLDVPSSESSSDAGRVRRNLFHIPGSFEEMEITFSDSPLPSVMALLAIRNRGRPFDHTHMGRILQGQILTEKDFKRVTAVPSENA